MIEGARDWDASKLLLSRSSNYQLEAESLAVRGEREDRDRKRKGEGQKEGKDREGRGRITTVKDREGGDREGSIFSQLIPIFKNILYLFVFMCMFV